METMVKTTEKKAFHIEERVMDYILHCEMKNSIELLRKELNYLQKSPAFMSTFNVSMDLLMFAYDRLEYCTGTVRQLTPSTNVEPVSVNEVINDEIVTLQSTDHTKVNVSAEYGSDVFVTGNRYQIGRCFFHLFQNALEACTDGDSLTVRTWTMNDRVYVEIRDTGAGMTPSECECMFVPFYTTKRKDHRGLGAFIAKRIIENHGGTIGVVSIKDHGTTVLIHFPK